MLIHFLGRILEMSVGEQIANSPEVRASMEIVYAKFAVIDNLRKQTASHEQNVTALLQQVDVQEQNYTIQQALYADIIQNLVNMGASAPEISNSQLVLNSALEANAIRQTITIMQSQIQNIRDTIAKINAEIEAIQAIVEATLNGQVQVIQSIMTAAGVKSQTAQVSAAPDQVSAAPTPVPARVLTTVPIVEAQVSPAPATSPPNAAAMPRQARVRVPRPATSPPGSAIVEAAAAPLPVNPRAWPIGVKK